MGQNSSNNSKEPVGNEPKEMSRADLFRSERIVKKPKGKESGFEKEMDLFKSERVVKGQPEFKKKEGFFNKENF